MIEMILEFSKDLVPWNGCLLFKKRNWLTIIL